MANSMNAPYARQGVALENALVGRLREILTDEVTWLDQVSVERNPVGSDRGYDLSASFRLPEGVKVELRVEVKADPRPSRFPQTVAERKFDRKALSQVRIHVLAAPNISPRMAEVCESHGWSWFDLAGNFRISIPGVIHLQHTGNPPIKGTEATRVNLGTPETARIARALLTIHHTGLLWTQRAMQRECSPGVSLGLVNKVVRHLNHEGYIENLSGGGFRVTDPMRLLFAWRDAYRPGQHERRGYFTLLSAKALKERLADLDTFYGGFACYAAFSAAELQAPHVRQPKTWLYISPETLDLFEKKTEARQVDSGENLVVFIPSDPGVFFQADSSQGHEHRLRCTNLVQTYVDLWHAGGRGKEAAEALLEQRLKPVWKANGYTA